MDEDRQLAAAMIGLGEETLARVLKELDDDARHALRRLRHPITGELLQLSGLEAMRPPQHQPGSGIER